MTMNPDIQYFFAVALISVALFADINLIYGKLRRKPLIGDYKPGSADYTVFLKLISKPIYSIVALAATALLVAILLLSIRDVLSSPSSHGILIAAPVMTIIAYAIMLGLNSDRSSRK